MTVNLGNDYNTQITQDPYFVNFLRDEYDNDETVEDLVNDIPTDSSYSLTPSIYEEVNFKIKFWC